MFVLEKKPFKNKLLLCQDALTKKSAVPYCDMSHEEPIVSDYSDKWRKYEKFDRYPVGNGTVEQRSLTMSHQMQSFTFFFFLYLL